MIRSTCCVLPLALLAVSLAESVSAAPPVRILCLGDSITKGVRSGVTHEQTFEAHLQTWLSDHVLPVTVINSGIGGERTDQALQRLSRDVIAQKPAVVCVMYGTNDSAIDVGKSDPRLPLSAYEANLDTIVDRLRAADIRPVLMTPIPLCTGFSYMSRPPYSEQGPNHRLIDYVHAVRRVALRKGVRLVDHFGAWSEYALMGIDLNTLTTDGCHPNPAGHRRMAETMYPLLAAMLGGEPVPPTPAGTAAVYGSASGADGNLALHCSYEESAPNRFGYGAGLTDGVRHSDSKPGVYATDGEPNYPKITTIDLGEVHALDRVVVHNSTDGSTKTVSVGLSSAGKTFIPIGTHQFDCGDGASFSFSAGSTRARYVRLTFQDTWGNVTHGSPDFMFLREVEVFGR